MKKCWMAAVSLLLMLSVSVLTVAAETTLPLLKEDTTYLTKRDGAFSYAPQNVLIVQAPTEAGTTAAIDIKTPVNVKETPFLQLSVSSAAPFNIALKLQNGDFAVFPQLAGPSWYEAFQEQVPPDGGGVNAGHYTCSLNIESYLRYNDLGVPEDGVVTIETVFIMLKGAGELTVEHLALSDVGEFQTAFGTVGTTAYSPAAVTTATHGTARPTQPTYDAGGVTRYQSDDSPIGMIVIMVAAGVAVGAMIVLTILRARKSKPREPEPTDTAEEKPPEEDDSSEDDAVEDDTAKDDAPDSETTESNENEPLSE